jgi:hypothetical protein
MTFKFKPAQTKQPTTSNSNYERRDVDWEALNAHLIEAAGTATNPEVYPGVISQIVDLGIHLKVNDEVVDPDFTYPEDASFYDVKGEKRVKYTTDRELQYVAVLVDFPDIIVDKSLYITGESNPLPLRLLLNGERMVQNSEGKWINTVSKMFSLGRMKHPNGKYALAKQNKLHVLAEKAGLLDSDGLFTVDRIGELLGKALMFEIQLFMKPGNNGKRYYNEIIKSPTIIPRSIKAPTLDPSLIGGVLWSDGSDPDENEVKKLRASVKNTIKNATNFNGSTIAPLIEAKASPSAQPTASLDKPREQNDNTRPVKEPAKPAQPKAAVTKTAPAKAASWEDESEDSDSPF